MSDLPDWKTISAAERDRLLADFCAQGFTAQQISNSFYNCSRSAAIGRIHRLKLQLGGGAQRKGKTGRRKAAAGPSLAPKPRPPKRTARTAEVVSWRGAKNPHHNDLKARAEQRAASPGLPAHLVAGEPIRVRAETSHAPASLKFDLMQLTDKTCRWPQGDPLVEGFHFCGNDTAETSPYCRYHSRLAYEPATIRQRASLRSAERIR